MRSWFLQLNQREQLSLLVLGLAIGLYLLYVLVWSPLDGARDRLAEQNVGVAGSLQRVDAMVSEITRLRESGARPESRRNLTSLINQSTSALALPVSRLQPNSRGEIQVRFENAAFDLNAKVLMDWPTDIVGTYSVTVTLTISEVTS